MVKHNDHYSFFVIAATVGLSFVFLDRWTGFVTKLTRRVSLVEQELPTLPEHLSSPPVFSGVRVTRSLVLCVCFVDRCFVLLYFFFWPLCCPFFFDIWYLQSLVISPWMYLQKIGKPYNLKVFGSKKTKEGLIRLANILQYNEKCQLYKLNYISIEQNSSCEFVDAFNYRSYDVLTP